MIISDAKDLVFNGNSVQLALYNGTKVWPKNNTLGYRVYISWAPEQYQNITLDGMWWNGPMMTEDLIYSETVYPDASYKDNQGWHTMSWGDVDKMIATGTDSLSKYCSDISFRIDSTAFNTFEFKTDPYYQPNGNVLVQVNELTDDGPITRAEKVVSMAPNTTYTIFRGDHL